MPEIPVGSPPVPPGRHAAPGGWYPDPVDPTRERYWDGWQWSRNVRPRPAAQLPGTPSRPAGTRGGYVTGAPQATLTADGVPLAGWWWRVLAALLDNVFSSAVVAVVAFPIWRSMAQAVRRYLESSIAAQQAGGPVPGLLPTDLISTRDQLVLTLASVTVGMVYHVAFLRWRSATPGKLIVGLRVVPVDRGHYPGQLGWAPVLLRAGVWVLPGLSSLLSLVSLVDALFPIWQPKRQALHDLAAGTQVVKRG